MSPIEIIFVLLGIGILIASCFAGSKEEQTETHVTISEEVLETQKQEIKSYADQMLEEKSEEIIVRTDDYLSKISNEKIMSVNDFSSQILEKIDANHKEVVFLYDMLNQKEDEIKLTVRDLEHEKQEMQEVVEQIIKLTKQMKESIGRSDTAKASTAEKAKKQEAKKTVAKPAVKSPVQPAELPKTAVTQTDGQLEFADMMQADHQKEEVLKLHKQGKSILDISKTLGMGQGEVKLIIGLYGA